MIKIYTDGACSVNPGIGGWGAIIIFESGEEKEISGSELETTNNRMEITAVIESLEIKELNIEDKVKIYSDSTYVINTITKNWKRNTNNDLWDKLDNLLEKRIVEWEWVKGHSGNKYNEIADKLAVNAINELKKNNLNELSHLDSDGSIKMVDVSEKEITSRSALVSGKVVMKKETLEIIKKGEHGALLFHHNKIFSAPALPLAKVLDPTGAGDSFAGGVIGYIAKYGLDNPVEAVVHGSAVASYTVSGFGLEQLLKLNQKELNHRINQVSFR